MATGKRRVLKTVDGENLFTDPISLTSGGLGDEYGWGQLSIASAAITAGTIITLQRSLDAGVSWEDVEEFITAIEREIHCPTVGVLWRVGVLTGNFPSAQADIDVGIFV